jgi:hypothetical protein
MKLLMDLFIISTISHLFISKDTKDLGIFDGINY